MRRFIGVVISGFDLKEHTKLPYSETDMFAIMKEIRKNIEVMTNPLFYDRIRKILIESESSYVDCRWMERI